MDHAPPLTAERVLRRLEWRVVRRLDGALEEFGGCAQTVVHAGEAVTVVTPTAGGYGKAE